MLLQPVNQRNANSNSPDVLISYKSNAITTAPEHEKQDEHGEELEAYGIVGI